MHDYFHILGLPSDARARDIRRACASRVRRVHPDFHGGAAPAPSPSASCPDRPSRDYGSADFVQMTSVIDRMREAFFKA